MHEHYEKCGEVVKQYLIYKLAIKGCSVNTVNSYYKDLQLFFKFIKLNFGLAESDKDFDSIKTDDIDIELIKKINTNDIYEFIYFVISKRKNNSKTRARKTSTIKGFFKYLTCGKKMLTSNPAEALSSPKIKSTLPKYLNLEESKNLLKNIDGSFAIRDYCIITLFLNCGLRLAELVALDVSDIIKNPITVTGKGNKERSIYLNEACRSAISDYLNSKERIPREYEIALFLNKDGTRISKRRVQEIIKFNLKKNNLYGYSTHKLRHTAATLMFQYGNVDIKTLQEILGHKNLTTTQIYTHVSSKQLKDAINSNPLSSIKK